MTQRERQLLEWIRENPLISQQELADKSGVSRVTIALIENGQTRDVMASTLLKLANALNMSVNDLFF